MATPFLKGGSWKTTRTPQRKAANKYGAKLNKNTAITQWRQSEKNLCYLCNGALSSMVPPVIPSHVRRQKLKYLQFQKATQNSKKKKQHEKTRKISKRD